MKFNINFYFYIIIILLPLFLVTGPFLPDLAASIIAIFFLFKLYSGKYKFLILNKYTLFISIFCLSALLSSILSENIILSFESSLFYIRFYLFSLGALILISIYKKKINILFLIMALCILIVSIDAIFEYFNGTNILGNSAFPGRIAGLFGEEWIIGSYLVRLLPLLFFLFFYFKFYENINYLILFLITSILSMCAILLSGERAALLLLLLFLFSISIIYTIKFFSFKKILLFPILIIIFSFPLFFDKSYNRIVEDLNYHTSLDKSENIYLVYYSNSLEMFKEKPLFGHGPRMYRLECKKYKTEINNQGCNTHPHNYYFQLLAENGIIGFLIIILFFTYFLKKLFHEIKKSYSKEQHFIAKISLLLCFIINLWPFIPTTSFYNNWLGVIIYIPLIFYLYTIFKENLNTNVTIGSLGRTRTATGVNPTGF